MITLHIIENRLTQLGELGLTNAKATDNITSPPVSKSTEPKTGELPSKSYKGDKW